MKIKTSKGIKEVNEVFPNLETFKDHVLKLDKNIRYNNETIKKEIESLVVKLEEQEGVVSLSLMRGWLIKNYGFKTKKWSNIEYFIERGWSEENAFREINKRNKELKQRNRLCKEYWMNKGFTKEESTYKISHIQSIHSKCVINHNGKSKIMLREKGYSEEEIERICLTPTKIKFWLDRDYSVEDAEIIIRTNQSNATKYIDYDNILSPVKIEYWINKGYSEKEAIKLRSERQKTFSKNICIEKYGPKEGLKVFNMRQVKWQKELYKNGKLKSGYSLISQELFKELIIDYETNYLNNIFFAIKGGEMVLEDNTGFYRYDFTDIKSKKIIEYNGDDYHANPTKYKDGDYPHPFIKNITSKEIWDKDKKKKILAENFGFEILTVWDSEYKKNKIEVINKCKIFLNKK